MNSQNCVVLDPMIWATTMRMSNSMILGQYKILLYYFSTSDWLHWSCPCLEIIIYWKDLFHGKVREWEPPPGAPPSVRFPSPKQKALILVDCCGHYHMPEETDGLNYRSIWKMRFCIGGQSFRSLVIRINTLWWFSDSIISCNPHSQIFFWLLSSDRDLYLTESVARSLSLSL